MGVQEGGGGGGGRTTGCYGLDLVHAELRKGVIPEVNWNLEQLDAGGGGGGGGEVKGVRGGRQEKGKRVRLGKRVRSGKRYGWDCDTG